MNFERVQSKFRITDDINETSESETESTTELADERITEIPGDKQKYFERINAMRNEMPSRKRKRLIAAKIDEKCIDRLKLMQTEIGWDNLLRVKLTKGWKICQQEHEAMQTKKKKLETIR